MGKVTADIEAVRQRVNELMPSLLEQLSAFVRIPSIAFPAFPSEPVLQMASAVSDLFQSLGAASVQLLDVPDGPPAVFAQFPASSPTNSSPAASAGRSKSESAPTVLLYAHYDVQPAPLEQGWHTDPWTPTLLNGRLYGRGAADNKSGIVMHAGALQALQVFGNERSVNINVLIEGDEEAGSHLIDLIAKQPELVQCNTIIIADSGNQRVGQPAITSALRGLAACKVTVRTLDHPVHSGLFGGPVPDALVALVRMLATLHDDQGNVAVSGLHSYEWNGGNVEEESVRKDAEVLENIELIGNGSLASRLWSKPSISVIGIDAPATAVASNVLLPQATAMVSMRVAPGGDEQHELQLLMQHLQNAAPWGVHVEIVAHGLGAPFAADTSGSAIAAAKEALKTTYGVEVDIVGSGGSIPLVAAVKSASPDTEVIIWGAEDTAAARIHGSDESVDIVELEQMIVAQTLFLQNVGQSGPQS